MKIVKIGRSSSNDVNIDDPLVSRAHCQIIQDDNGNFRLIDTNSKNGTYLNGTKRHGEIRIKESDIIRIGNTTLPWQSYFYRLEPGGPGSGTIVGPVPPQKPPRPPKPNNFLVWAILSTIFCCLPFGIVSIVYASKVDNLWYAGDYDEAENAAYKARSWFWWAFAFGILLGIVSCIIFLIKVGILFRRYS